MAEASSNRITFVQVNEDEDEVNEEGSEVDENEEEEDLKIK